ncbi:hypothetical protein PGT21_031924 [Puccinia graminis f. sp. tritici]|uniref:Uncharacterized protein n=1 Tax=Puccinia graminis f. sp. tritici TaxID=56615 RepID=A0A5B0N7W3_PUCGR|nr:hypothetical protein PGT21_031924 [Puccinia graminis f. sp. tritici]
MFSVDINTCPPYNWASGHFNAFLESKLQGSKLINRSLNAMRLYNHPATSN